MAKFSIDEIEVGMILIDSWCESKYKVVNVDEEAELIDVKFLETGEIYENQNLSWIKEIENTSWKERIKNG